MALSVIPILDQQGK